MQIGLHEVLQGIQSQGLILNLVNLLFSRSLRSNPQSKGALQKLSIKV